MRSFCLTALLAATLPTVLAAQDDYRWRHEPAGDGPPAAVYGGTNAEDFAAILFCATDPDGTPFITAEIVVETADYAEGASAMLEFYGPAWTASMPVTVNGPGLYPTVTARITFSEADTLYRALFNNVDQALLRLRPDLPSESVDFSLGRADVVAFMAECESWRSAGDGPLVLQP